MRYWIALCILLVPGYFFVMQPSKRTVLLKHIKPIEVVKHDSGIAGIDTIYCINLDIRKEKWDAMQRELSEQRLKATRVSAVNGWAEISKETIKKIHQPFKARLNPGQMGCLLSHLSILQDGEKRGFDRILILEDDVNFVGDMKTVSSSITEVTECDPDWDILYLDDWDAKRFYVGRPEDRPHSKMSENIKKPKESLEGASLVKTYYRHGNYTYVVSKKGMKKILAYFSKTPLYHAYDLELNHIPDIKMYETRKDFVSVNTTISDTVSKPKVADIGFSKYLKKLQVMQGDTGIEGIDVIYCINLDIRKEKWEVMQRHFSQQRLQANRVPAVNGWTELTKENRQELNSPNNSKLVPGEIGCLLSHLSILRDAADRGCNQILVLEDDVEFIIPMQNVSQYIKELTENDPNWDILFLDDWHRRQNPKKPKIISRFSPVEYRMGAYAMVLSKKGIRKMVDYFFKHSLDLPIDVEMNRIEGIKMYETGIDFVQVSKSITDTAHKPTTRKLAKRQSK